VVQKEKTYCIGDAAVKGSNNSTIAICNMLGALTSNVFAPIIVMTMDLDYAHLDRFEEDDLTAVIYRYAKVRYWWNKKVAVPHSGGVPGEIIVPTLLPPEMSAKDIQNLGKTETVEEEHGDFYYFNSRLSGTKAGQLFWVHPTEYKNYEYWEIQKTDTLTAVKNHPWRLVPLYHFEPRRYTKDCEEAFLYVMDKTTTSAKSQKPRLFIGIKLYPNLGYKPADLRLSSLVKLYTKCAANDIPIMVHCSPNGAFTHDRPLYYENDMAKAISAKVANPELDALNGVDKSVFYFMQEYSSPHAWEPVFQDHPNLRLCLAHFGGSDNRPDSTEKNEKQLSGWNFKISQTGDKWDERYWNQKIIAMMQKYPNLYTDLSCHVKEHYIENLPNAIIRWPDLRKRILFGTDWYMTEMDTLNYQQFVEQAKEGIDYIDDIVRKSGKVPEKDPPLWQWMTEINPFRFYRFDRIAKEYSKELERRITADSEFKDSVKAKKIDNLSQQKQLIYAISKRLKTMGELPDAVTND
jgi:predicted TIM-barrel fold metal-dependent hydrolase